MFDIAFFVICFCFVILCYLFVAMCSLWFGGCFVVVCYVLFGDLCSFVYCCLWSVCVACCFLFVVRSVV